MRNLLLHLIYFYIEILYSSFNLNKLFWKKAKIIDISFVQSTDFYDELYCGLIKYFIYINEVL